MFRSDFGESFYFILFIGAVKLTIVKYVSSPLGMVTAFRIDKQYRNSSYIVEQLVMFSRFRSGFNRFSFRPVTQEVDPHCPMV